MTSKAIAEFTLQYPTKSRIFSSQLNQVCGTAKLQIPETINNVLSIDLGLKGDVRSRKLDTKDPTSTSMSLYEDSISMNPSTDSESVPSMKKFNVKVDILFNESKPVYTLGTKVYLPGGTFLEFPIDFHFPSGKFELPSSIDDLSIEDRKLTIRYELYLRIKIATGSIHLPEYFDFLAPLKYQGGSTPEYISRNATEEDEEEPSELLRYKIKDDKKPASDVHIFPRKEPEVEYDPKDGLMKVIHKEKLSETVLENNPTTTAKKQEKKISIKANTDPGLLKRIVLRKSSTASEGDDKVDEPPPVLELDEHFIHNIRLRISTKFKNGFNLAESLADIPIEFEVPVITTESHDFSVKGVSTKLGYFEVKEIKLEVVQNFQLYQKPSTRTIVVLSETLEDKRSIDVNQFRFDTKTGDYFYTTTLGEFITESGPVLESVQKPLMGTIGVADYFMCESSLKMSIFILPSYRGPSLHSSYGTVDTGKEKSIPTWFELVTEIPIDCKFESSELETYQKIKRNHLASGVYRRHFQHGLSLDDFGSFSGYPYGAGPGSTVNNTVQTGNEACEVSVSTSVLYDGLVPFDDCLCHSDYYQNFSYDVSTSQLSDCIVRFFNIEPKELFCDFP
ncbi:unnamed protein product [Ambrosiozyma monospora]|uniref:Unnamed protein product n=1 Tax=Ambrosiozyma monospora TaxID=43982 RepID=A0ACB5T869_AMBMO|nr:unnamed protein product [Ambrosiozyma monospora]